MRTMTCLIGMDARAASEMPSVSCTAAPVVNVQAARCDASGSAAIGDGHVPASFVHAPLSPEPASPDAPPPSVGTAPSPPPPPASVELPASPALAPSCDEPHAEAVHARRMAKR